MGYPKSARKRTFGFSSIQAMTPPTKDHEQEKACSIETK
jgi:hypothetical protein